MFDKLIGMATGVPAWVWKTLAIIAVLTCIFFYIYNLGAASVQAKWDLEKLQTENATIKLEGDQAGVTVKTVTEYVEVIKEVKVKGDTIYVKVPEYIPSDSCPMPAGFRVLHKAAVHNIVP